MAHSPLSNTVLAVLDISAQIASAGVNGSAVDMQGWDGIEYEFNIGTMASGAAFDARIMSSANSNMSGATNITNAALTQVTNAANANLFIIDIWKPTDRYVKAVTTPATANVTFSVVSRRYHRNGLLPPTQATTTTVVSVASN